MKKIIDKPDSLICKRCGCKFEYELEDVKIGYHYNNGKRVRYVSCPCCGDLIEL